MTVQCVDDSWSGVLDAATLVFQLSMKRDRFVGTMGKNLVWVLVRAGTVRQSKGVFEIRGVQKGVWSDQVLTAGTSPVTLPTDCKIALETTLTFL